MHAHTAMHKQTNKHPHTHTHTTQRNTSKHAHTHAEPPCTHSPSTYTHTTNKHTQLVPEGKAGGAGADGEGRGLRLHQDSHLPHIQPPPRCVCTSVLVHILCVHLSCLNHRPSVCISPIFILALAPSPSSSLEQAHSPHPPTHPRTHTHPYTDIVAIETISGYHMGSRLICEVWAGG